MLLPFILLFALINSCIELEISAPSFPSIMHYFNVTETAVGLTITYNLIGFCLAACLYGPLSDAFGRRKIMILGNGILTIGAIACVLSPSMPILLFARFIQGFGAATSAVVVSAIIADHYQTEKATKLYGIMNAVFTTLMALSPVIGGFTNQWLGWRGSYSVVAIICVISWVLLLVFLPETKQTKESLAIKKVLIDYKTLFSSRLFLAAAAVPSLLYGCYMAFVTVAPFLYMKALRLSMFDYTLNQAIVVATFAVVSACSGKIIERLKAKKTVALALFASTIGISIMLFIQSVQMLTFSMSIFSIGFALAYPVIFSRSMEIFPEFKGTASSAIISLRYLICATLTGLASHYYQGDVISLALLLLITLLLIITSTIYLYHSKLFSD